MRVRTSSGDYADTGARRGIAPLILVVAVIAIVAVAGIGAYYFVFSGGSTASSSGTTTSSRTTGTSSTGMTGTTSTTGSSSITTYSATFNFSNPEGPSGERVFSNDTVQTYNTVQFGSGSFTFFINAANESGSGSGHGTLTVKTTGFCSGTTSFPYTFKIPDATTILGNLTIFVGTPTPGNFTVALSCTGPMNGVSTTTNNPSPFLSTYPNEFTITAVPAIVDQHLSGNISYYLSLTKTS